MEELFEEGAESNLNEDVLQLHAAWRNEACAPGLLHSQQHLVDTLLQQLREQQEIIDEAKTNPEEYFSASLYQMEIDRLRYGIARYLRTRLLKLQEQPTDDASLLSEHEKSFSIRLSEIENAYLDTVLLSALPEDIRSIDKQPPSADDYVFVRVQEDTGDVEVGPGEYANMLKDDVHVLLFRRAQHLLSQGKLVLL